MIHNSHTNGVPVVEGPEVSDHSDIIGGVSMIHVAVFATCGAEGDKRDVAICRVVPDLMGGAITFA